MRQTKPDWNLVAKTLEDKLSAEQKQIVESLAEGKTQAEVASALGQHRSMIWRKVQYIRSHFLHGTL